MRQYFVQNAPLAPYCTYHIGGRAKYLAAVYDADGLLRAMELPGKKTILGRGSKVLVSDAGVDGTVILMRNSEIKERSGEIYAEAGVELPFLSRFYASRGLSGLEWACGIPATVGGALRLNAGAYGGDISQIVLYADVLREGKIKRLGSDECGFAYRHSGFYPSDVIVGAGLRANSGDLEQIAALRKECARRRNSAQPGGFCCGSIFKADEKPAYTYIQECGLKGLCEGDAEISDKHANFIVNRGSATAKDVYTLIRTIKAEVFCRLGIKLCEEVVYVGDF